MSFATSFFRILGFGFGSRRGGLCTFGYVDLTLVKTGLGFVGFEILPRCTNYETPIVRWNERNRPNCIAQSFTTDLELERNSRVIRLFLYSWKMERRPFPLVTSTFRLDIFVTADFPLLGWPGWVPESVLSYSWEP